MSGGVRARLVRRTHRGGTPTRSRHAGDRAYPSTVTAILWVSIGGRSGSHRRWYVTVTVAAPGLTPVITRIARSGPPILRSGSASRHQFVTTQGESDGSTVESQL